MAEPVRLDIWSDVVCPFCFLASTSVEKLQKNYNIDLHWHSFLLRPEGTEFPPEKIKQIEASQPALLAMARQHYGVELHQGPLETDSIPAHIMTKYAESQGKGEAFHKAVMEAYWLRSRRVDDFAVLAEIAQEVGLKDVDIPAIVENPTYKKPVMEDVEEARMYNLHSVPALIFAEKYLVSGAQPYEIMQRVIEKVQAEA